MLGAVDIFSLAPLIAGLISMDKLLFWGFENDDIFRSHGIMWMAHRNLWRAPTPKVRMTLPTLKHPHANILIREPMVGTLLVRSSYEDDHILHPTPIFCYCERTQVQINKATLHSYYTSSHLL